MEKALEDYWATTVRAGHGPVWRMAACLTGVGDRGWCAWQVPKSLSDITNEAVESLAAALAAGD